MKVSIYTQEGVQNGTMELPEAIFDRPFNKDLVHQALVRQLANSRSPLAHTKTREEIRGGGKKPYKQKGTGRARQGSTRSPQFTGGAIIFGPLNTRNFSKDMPKKQRRVALFSALSQKAREEGIVVLDSYTNKEPKTKIFSAMLKKIGPKDRSFLIVTAEKDEIIEKSSKNIANAKSIMANYLNIHDLQKYKKVILLKDAIEQIEKTFLPKAK